MFPNRRLCLKLRDKVNRHYVLRQLALGDSVRKRANSRSANSRSANSLPHRAELWPILHIFIFLIIIISFIFTDFFFYYWKNKQKKTLLAGGRILPVAISVPLRPRVYLSINACLVLMWCIVCMSSQTCSVWSCTTVLCEPNHLIEIPTICVWF